MSLSCALETGLVHTPFSLNSSSLEAEMWKWDLSGFTLTWCLILRSFSQILLLSPFHFVCPSDLLTLTLPSLFPECYIVTALIGASVTSYLLS